MKKSVSLRLTYFGMKVKILDRYIISKFLSTFLFSIVLIISLAIVIDLTEKIDDFFEKEAPLRAIVFDYYFNFIPYYANLFMFLFIFIAVVFFTSKMTQNTEVIAIISSGVSFRRFMMPYFFTAAVLAASSFVLSNFIIPPANRIRLDFEDTYINNTFYNRDRHIHRQLSPGVFMYMENFNTRNNVGFEFSLETFEGKELKSKLLATKLQWDTVKNKWKITKYQIRTFDGDNETLEFGKEIDTTLNISPEDFKRRDTEKAKMDFFELNDYISDAVMRGETNVNNYLLEKHQRIAFPFSTFILTLIGVVISSRKRRGGTGLNIGIGLLLSFMYLFFMQMASQFTIKGNLNPIISAWLPNAVFAIIALFMYRIAPK